MYVIFSYINNPASLSRKYLYVLLYGNGLTIESHVTVIGHEEGHEESFQDCVLRMARNSEWGGDLEIQVCRILTKFNIDVYQRIDGNQR